MADEEYNSKDYKTGERIGRKGVEVTFKGLMKIAEFSATKKKISWQDGNPFTTDLSDIISQWKKGHDALIALGDKLDKKGAVSDDLVRGVEDGQATATTKFLSELKDRPLIDELVGNLQANFQRYYVDTSPYKKNLQVPAGITSPDALFKHLLDNNRGLALSDLHIQEEMTKFLHKNMKAFKESGGDTIYFDFPPDEMESINKMTVEEFRKDLKGADWQTSAKGNAMLYKVKESDSLRELYEALLAAKEEGIRLVCMDKRDLGENVMQKGISMRYAVTNFEWAHKIEEDRKDRSGKFLVFGGVAHFANSAGPSNGLVDDALGIPNLGFVYTKTEDGKFHAGTGSGIDFCLHGGPDYVAKMLDGQTFRQDEAEFKKDALSPTQVKSKENPRSL